MLEFSDEKVVGTAIVELPITEIDIETIMVNGIEGAIGYWARLNRTPEAWGDKPRDEPASMWATKLLLEGKEVIFTDADEEDDEIWTLNLNKLIKGIAQNAKENPEDSDLDNGDASTFDNIIQYALFDKVVFG